MAELGREYTLAELYWKLQSHYMFWHSKVLTPVWCSTSVDYIPSSCQCKFFLCAKTVYFLVLIPPSPVK